jgi:3-oxoacyl-[acyl-carrier-protein] synthase-3
VRYRNVCIEGLGHVIPDQVVSSAWFEEQLRPVYDALGISIGSIERLTGIRERRWFPPGFAPSEGAAEAGERALAAAGIPLRDIGCIVNASVSRDFLEPSTASIVHHKLGLPRSATNFDVTNACLGFLNGMVVASNMIELGQVDAALVVACENPREGQLATIERMRSGPPSLEVCFENLASFTIGAGAVAMVLSHACRSRTGHHLLGGYGLASTEHHGLCAAGVDWMRTRSKELLAAGLETIRAAWEGFRAEFGWEPAMIDRVFTHQVAEKQRRLGLEMCGFRDGQDYPTLATLGNIASVSAPLGLALAAEAGVLSRGDQLCLVGVGSGINSLVLGMAW